MKRVDGKLVESRKYKGDENYNRIIIISDVHGLIEELDEFFKLIEEKYGDSIAYCLQLGDFFKGRNVLKGEKTFSFWKDTTIFSKYPFPIYCIKGNEDINIPENWYSGMLSLLPNMQEFYLDEFSLIPIHYFEESKEFYKKMGIKKLIKLPPSKYKGTQKFRPMFDYQPLEDHKVSTVLTDKSEIDFIASHNPPYGLLDKTRDYHTHKEINFTGNKFIRLIIDKRRPKIVLFGHNHYSNFQKFGDMLIISVDKFCRKIRTSEKIEPAKKTSKSKRKIKKTTKITKQQVQTGNDKNYFNYVLITRQPSETIVEMFSWNKLILKYHIQKQEIMTMK